MDTCSLILRVLLVIPLYRVSQEESSIFWGGHSIGYSQQKCVYVHVSYFERFPR
jgi:hypothetical protein